MAKPHWKHVTIIGVGLLGGSAGLAIKASVRGVHVAGVGRRQASLDEALAVGAIDSAHLDAAEAVRGTDLVILATPVGAFETHLRAIAPVLDESAVVTDVGSTKREVVRTAARVLGRDGRFVGSHPMAGSERKGPAFARADLFEGATCILTPTKHTPSEAKEIVYALWDTLGMRRVEMAPAAHDRALAHVSHLPHVVSSLLMLLPRARDLDVAATGFRDTTRLASGDPEMWRDILLSNRDAMLDAVDELDERLVRLRDLLEVADADELEKLLARAKARRDETIATRMLDPSEPAG